LFASIVMTVQVGASMKSTEESKGRLPVRGGPSGCFDLVARSGRTGPESPMQQARDI
jgi:hypothetical protein